MPRVGQMEECETQHGVRIEQISLLPGSMREMQFLLVGRHLRPDFPPKRIPKARQN